MEANIQWSLRENHEERGDFVGLDSVAYSNAWEFGVGAEQFVAAAHVSRDHDSGHDRHHKLPASQRGDEHRIPGFAAAAVRKRACEGYRKSGPRPD